VLRLKNNPGIVRWEEPWRQNSGNGIFFSLKNHRSNRPLWRRMRITLAWNWNLARSWKRSKTYRHAEVGLRHKSAEETTPQPNSDIPEEASSK
jgi:hypothetical protein